MSQTPNAEENAGSAADYLAAWQQITRWTEEGRSWSGREKNCCLLNIPGSAFADVSAVSGINYPDDARGLAIVDWDHDGRLDFWLSARTAPQIRLMHNSGTSTGNFVSVHLTAENGNRDAIGARIEVILEDDETGLVTATTLRAGEGYLSQSSKWCHLGLGDANRIKQLRVLWPNGSQQTWDDLAVNQHYLLRENEPAANTWQRPTAATFVPGTPIVPTSDAAFPYLLAGRMPLPQLTYQTAEGASRAVADGASEKLVLLWASWCGPCLEEMAKLASRYDQLQESGLEILSLSVDGLTDDSTDFSDAMATAERLKLPWELGRATPELLDALQGVSDELFSAKRALPLPSAFLISENRLVAIYRGAADADRVLEDVASVTQSGNALLDQSLASIGTAGRWQFAPPASYTELYLERAMAQLAKGEATAAVEQLRTAMKDDPQNALLHFQMGRVLLQVPERVTEAEASFQESMALAPEPGRAAAMIADLWMAGGRTEEAKRYYEKAVARGDYPDAHSKLGIIAARSGNPNEAIEHFQSAAKLLPNDSMAHGNLGKALMDQGRRSEAKENLERAVSLSDENVAAMLNLSWLLSTSPEPELRDGRRALELAVRCERSMTNPNPVTLDRLAAAQAENGNFAEAAKNVRLAIAIWQRQNQPGRIAELRHREKLYQNEQPYRKQGE